MRWQPARSILAVEIAAVMLSAPMILLAIDAALPAVLVGGLAYGAGAAVLNVMIGTVIQREVPVELLSRVFSIVQIVAGVFAPAGYALAGPAAAWLGPDQAVGVGAVAVLGSVAMLMCFAEVRRFGMRSAIPIT